MTTADKATNLKHDPVEEFRSSVYRRRPDEEGPTRLIFPATAFKRALAEAALDMPGSASKAKIGRLCYVGNTFIDIYGIPQLHMSVVRMADIARTPDVRTRAILPEWCAQISVHFMEPILSATTVSTLFAAAGVLCGIGDFRQQKGGGNLRYR